MLGFMGHVISSVTITYLFCQATMDKMTIL